MSRIRRFRADLGYPQRFPKPRARRCDQFRGWRLDVMRLNRALLAAFLCSATAPVTMCDPTDQMSPLIAGPGTTLRDSDATVSRAMAAPNTLAPEAFQLPDATVVLLQRPAVNARPSETTAEVDTLPSTSTAPEPELQARLLMACLGFVLAVAGGVMLLLPRR
jgi:hypothetical protein